MAKNPIMRWRLHRGHLTTYVLGVPGYEQAGEAYFTGTNAEANAEARRRTAAEPEPGYTWSVIDKEPVEG